VRSARFKARATANHVPALELNAQPPYLILGTGNCLLGDDGVGVHVARFLATDPPADTLVLDIGTDFMSAVPYLEQSSNVLVVDAMDADGPPGTLYQCLVGDVAQPRALHSIHEVGWFAALTFVLPHRLPRVHVLGVQPARIGYGLDLSPELAAAVPKAAAAARAIVAAF
jgi:hydrogenase maturation protease